jgi:hypothetical protein
MRIFILDDEIHQWRAPLKEALKGHDLNIAISCDHAIKVFPLCMPYDLMLLDHDMEGFFEHRVNYPNTGAEFVKWVVNEYQRPCPRIKHGVFCMECGYDRGLAKYSDDYDQVGLPHVPFKALTPAAKIYFHSHNPNGRRNMESLIRQSGFCLNTEQMPFGPAYTAYIGRMYGKG